MRRTENVNRLLTVASKTDIILKSIRVETLDVYKRTLKSKGRDKSSTLISFDISGQIVFLLRKTTL